MYNIIGEKIRARFVVALDNLSSLPSAEAVDMVEHDNDFNGGKKTRGMDGRCISVTLVCFLIGSWVGKGSGGGGESIERAKETKKIRNTVCVHVVVAGNIHPSRH